MDGRLATCGASSVTNDYTLEIEAIRKRMVSSHTIECGQGWYPIIIACHKELVAIDPDYEIVQIKEKFGGLRYYYSSNHHRKKEMFDIEMKYETLSFSVCEETGKPGVRMKMKSRNWFKTLDPATAPEGWEVA